MAGESIALRQGVLDGKLYMWKGFRVFGKTFEAVLGGTIERNPGHGIMFHLKFRTYVYWLCK